MLEVLSDHERWDTRSWTEQVVDALCGACAWRRDMVPLPAEFVVRDDDQRLVSVRPVFDRLDEVDEMITAVRFTRITGVFVLVAQRLHEAHRRQLPGLRREQEVCFVLQV